MAKYIIRRLLLFVPMLWVTVTLVFVVFRLVPGDPAVLVAGVSATQETIQMIRHQMGLDQPLHVQYVSYLMGLLRGDFGLSAAYGSHVLDALIARYPLTLQLASTAMLFALAVGVTVGVISAVKQYSWVDYASMLGAIAGVSLPNFWLGLMLVMLFSVQLRLFPVTGAGQWNALVLPAITLATYPTAIIARMTRSSMLEVLRQDHVRTARAKGLAERVVVLRHALRGALIPTVTVAGIQFGYLLGGSIVVESVFAWPGVGLLMMDSIRVRDYSVVQAVTIAFGFTFLLINLVVDLLYAYLDPQVRYG